MYIINNDIAIPKRTDVSRYVKFARPCDPNRLPNVYTVRVTYVRAKIAHVRHTKYLTPLYAERIDVLIRRYIFYTPPRHRFSDLKKKWISRVVIVPEATPNARRSINLDRSYRARRRQ
ncbi:hypothetical protein PUN28_011003 [Cardiocondyla obscurior]|uniref:Ribosomal protein S10 n=1 Tax=Cardiocondyla obscurior TaxID=286306 RepID=A0AAW2FMA8_9HYME